MICTRQDYELVREAIREAIGDGRGTSGIPLVPGSDEQRLIEACGRLAAEPESAVLRAIGNYTLLCLVGADVAAMKAETEIRRLITR